MGARPTIDQIATLPYAHCTYSPMARQKPAHVKRLTIPGVTQLGHRTDINVQTVQWMRVACCVNVYHPFAQNWIPILFASRPYLQRIPVSGGPIAQMSIQKIDPNAALVYHRCMIHVQAIYDYSYMFYDGGKSDSPDQLACALP